MTLFRHELRRTRGAMLIWAAAIGFFMVICVVMFPDMKSQMSDVTDMFASMGSFTAAFGMDRLNFGEFLGFYSVECGNILGLGGAFYAALLGVYALSKEEKEHTADFLLTHPVSRAGVVTAKLCAVLFQLTVLNAAVLALTLLSVVCIGEAPDWSLLLLLHLAYYLLQIEIALICFAVSAFIRGSGAGIGLGLAVGLYFFNIIANISDSAHWLKYLTPFGYAESADIIADRAIDGGLLLLGAAVSAVSAAAAYAKYCRKDIR